MKEIHIHVYRSSADDLVHYDIFDDPENDPVDGGIHEGEMADALDSAFEMAKEYVKDDETGDEEE